jgi:hypothetical protein
LRNSLLVIVVLFLATLILGCSSPQSDKQTYKAIGEISNVQPAGGVVDGVRSLYIVTVGNLQPGSQPDPKDHQVLGVSITKETKIYISKEDKKMKASQENLSPGAKAEVIWSFANDHLTVIDEITILESTN